MNLKELVEARIVIDDEICHGKPRIKGTRITVADILLALAEGMSNNDILRNFRSIQGQDIQAAIAYAYCVSDNVKLKLKSSFGEQKLISNSNELVANQEIQTAAELEEEERKRFAAALEEQASIQEEITKEKVAQIKAKKTQKAVSPSSGSKKEPPKERPYDLLIDVSGEPSTFIFQDQDHLEQGLDMSFDNYIFELRKDGKPWLTYSVKEGIEIDPAMKRNLLVTYRGRNGAKQEAVFEGYLTTDRQHKVFLQKTPDGDTCGRAL